MSFVAAWGSKHVVVVPACWLEKRVLEPPKFRACVALFAQSSSSKTPSSSKESSISSSEVN